MIYSLAVNIVFAAVIFWLTWMLEGSRKDLELETAVAAYWWNRWRKADEHAQKRLGMLEDILGVVTLKMPAENARRDIIKIFKGMKR